MQSIEITLKFQKKFGNTLFVPATFFFCGLFTFFKQLLYVLHGNSIFCFKKKSIFISIHTLNFCVYEQSGLVYQFLKYTKHFNKLKSRKNSCSLNKSSLLNNSHQTILQYFELFTNTKPVTQMSLTTFRIPKIKGQANKWHFLATCPQLSNPKIKTNKKWLTLTL